MNDNQPLDPRRRQVDVLIIDDDRDTTDTLADLLSSRGYKVSVADSGAEALRFIERNPVPRLILLDLLTEGAMGGVEFMSYRVGSKWEHAPIILLSDLCTDAPMPSWVEQVLNRPIDLYKLIAAINQVIPPRQ